VSGVGREISRGHRQKRIQTVGIARKKKQRLYFAGKGHQQKSEAEGGTASLPEEGRLGPRVLCPTRLALSRGEIRGQERVGVCEQREPWTLGRIVS